MARMIPDDVSDFHNSYGEIEIFNVLRSLPKEYIVFHSVHWHRKNQGNIRWGESDFTIFDPKRGLIVIEVKSGGIKHSSGKWMQINTLTKESYSMKDPMVQAERSKYTFIDLITPTKNEASQYWVEAAVWFPSIEDSDLINNLPPAYSSGNVLTKKDLSSPLNSIERMFDYYGMSKKMYYSKRDVNWVIRKLSPEFNAIPCIANSISEQAHAFKLMTCEQSYLLDYLQEQRVAAIQGSAGTGKTILAVEKAKRLSNSGKVLFLCFNKFLLEYLKSSYASLGEDIYFTNLQALVCKNTGDLDAGSNDGISNFLNRFDSYDWPYRHIIVDEGQDFFDQHINLMSTIAEINNGNFYVFYDKNQLVHKRQSLDWLNSFECRLVLSTNCRNTKSIATTSSRTIGIDNVKMRIDIKGNKPNFYIEHSAEHAYNRIINTIRYYTDNGLSKSDIVILTAKTEAKSLLNRLSSVGPYRLSRDPNAQGILFTTARKYKGLESNVVIMIDIDDITFSNEEYLRVLYVGASRAKHYLDIISVLDKVQVANIAEHLSGGKGKKKNSKLKIATHLKVKILDNN